MARHNHLEHVTRRLRLRPWVKRCSCGNELPCPVRATLDRQQFFREPAAPGWAGNTRQLPRIAPRRGADRPLMTRGQEARSIRPGRR